mmetsp:Transcript_17243/g.24977  ORF Transcript_17243/g.24977 Transcript_17243/m.24977 type:complete len:397 (+) Transcript_17243:38-1228(+)
MPKKGGKRRKSRTHKEAPPEGANTLSSEGTAVNKADVPRSIVAKASKVQPIIAELVKDFRKLMSPYTATNLREKRNNRMKDYATVAGQLGITHLVMISQTEKNSILRIGKHSDGPTLHFKIAKFSLCSHVQSLQKRPFISLAAFMTAPLVVLNNFSQSEESHTKLMKVTFQHMFPTINVQNVKLSDCRRVVLFHLNKEDGTVEMRHYAIRATPVGISKGVKRIIQMKVPNLSELEDVSEFVEGQYGAGAISDSEAEDENSRVTLPDRYVGKGNAKSQQSAMKLTELGPRLTLELYKVEAGLNEGDILYHKFVQKSSIEAAKAKAKIEKLKNLKAQRTAVQKENVKRKRESEEEARKERMERKRQKYEGNGQKGTGDDKESDEEEGNASGGDDGDEE